MIHLILNLILRSFIYKLKKLKQINKQNILLLQYKVIITFLFAARLGDKTWLKLLCLFIQWCSLFTYLLLSQTLLVNNFCIFLNFLVVYFIQNNSPFLPSFFFFWLYITAHGRLNCEDDSDCADIPCVPPYVGKCVSLKCICRNY
jgi:hypothetical protein